MWALLSHMFRVVGIQSTRNLGGTSYYHTLHGIVIIVDYNPLGQLKYIVQVCGRVGYCYQCEVL